MPPTDKSVTIVDDSDYINQMNKQKIENVSHAQTNTFVQKIKDEYMQVRGGKGKYNPDLMPYQPSCLRLKNVDIEDPYFREKLLEDSKFLEKHTYERLQKIVERGWEVVKLTTPKTKIKTESVELIAHSAEIDVYNPVVNPTNDLPEEFDIPETIDVQWNDDLKVNFIDVVAKALVIDTAFITMWADRSFTVFTRNDVHLMYGDKRKIEEIYFRLPDLNQLKHMDESGYANVRAGFLTQYNESKNPKRGVKREHRFYAQNPEIEDENIYRSCVVVQPMPHMKEVFGIPFLKRECDTALRRLYLNYYEFLYMRKGGVNSTLAYMAGTSKTLKNNMAKSVYRGIQSLGVIMELKGGKVQESIMVADTPIPLTGGDFQTVADHIKEDSALTQQKIQGAATTGSLGSDAPVVNKQEDDEADLLLYGVLKKIIKDINFVFFEIMPDDCEIVFNRKRPPQMQEKQPDEVEMRKQDLREKDLEFRQKKFETSINTESSEHGVDSDFTAWFEEIDAEVVEHSVNDEFVSYQGNMLTPGLYNYSDKGQPPKIYTADEIKSMTQRDVKTGYMGIMHGIDTETLGVKEGVGYFEIKGFDPRTGQDITQFHIKKSYMEKYPQLIDKDHIKVSPYMSISVNESGSKDIYVMNCAIIPKGYKTRAEFSGLDTSATKL